MKSTLNSLVLVLLFVIFRPLLAQPENLSTSALIHQLNSLKTCGSVLYIAAHPDDENTRLISWLVNEKHYRTAYLSLTRGDGGQNLIGEEQGEQLGLIRTQELIAARRTDGAEQFFTRAYDFGYSKSPEETFRIWNREEVLADMVRVIRKFQPDVIICRFPTTGEGGHGHHTASAILAEEAFEQAADPTKFPEQLSELKIWKTHRLLWNTFNFGTRNTTSADQYSFDVGGYNPILGKSYGEISAESRSQHSSQAFGTARSRISQTEFFKTIKGIAPTTDLLDGTVTNWKRFANTDKIQTLTEALLMPATIATCISNPAEATPALIQLHTAILENPDIPSIWKDYYSQKVQKLILNTLGWYAEATSTQPRMVTGDSLQIQFNCVQRNSQIPVRITSIHLADFKDVIDSALMPSRLCARKFQIQVPEIPISQPYWLKAEKTKGMFIIEEDSLIGNAQNSPALSLQVNIEIENKYPLQLHIPVVYKRLDPSKGEVYQPLYATPPACLNFLRESFIFSTDAPKDISIKITAFKKNVQGTVRLILPEGWTSAPVTQDVQLALENEEKQIQFKITPPRGNRKNQILQVRAEIQTEGKTWNKSFVKIEYPHIPDQILFPEAQAVISEIQLLNPVKKVGYITGAGDKIPEALTECGIIVQEISAQEILENKLHQYDAVITGIRAWNTEHKLRTWHKALLQYVEQGGVLLIQYNTSQSLLVPQPGPYPMTLSRERVTDENAAVKFISDKDPVLLKPNKITQEDFLNWVQERGLYFPETNDPNYQKIISMADPGEKENENSVLYANYGKGKFVYTGLSFFRQLPAGVPGAYRLFINLISKNQ